MQKTQKSEKTITFYMKNVQPLCKTILFCKKLERKRSNFENTTAGQEEEEEAYTSKFHLGNRNRFDLARAPARTHARTKRNDFPGGAAVAPSPPPSDMAKCWSKTMKIQTIPDFSNILTSKF